MTPKFYPRRRDIEELTIDLEEHRDEFMFDIPDEWVNRMEYEEFLAELKNARVLEGWVNEISEDEIIERYGVEPGDLIRVVENADWLLYATHELAQLFQHKDLMPKLSELRARVENGVKPELLPLVRLKGIGRMRGRMLFNAGLRTIEDLKRATIPQLTSIPLIGPQLAKTIKEQIGGLVKPEEWRRLKGESWEQKVLSEY
jgi:helicase